MAVEMTWIREFAVLVPLAVVAVAILVVRTSVLTASLAGIAAAVLMSLWVGFEWQIANVRNMGLDSLLLTASVAMVIVPGLGFNALVRSHGLTRRLARWVRELPVTREGKTLLVLLGLAPAVESLTGFGVSMFLTVPILYPLYADRTARPGLLSMNIMPWGTLGLTAAWVLKAHRVEFHPLVSPGILLALAALVLFVRRPSHRIDVKDVFLKASRILVSVGLFLLLSQVLVQTGMLDAFVTRMSRGFTETVMIPVTVLLGAVSGFTTGSNLGGNALLIGAHGVDLASGDTAGLLLAALQNSSAGHAVFASVPMIVLLLGILRDESGGSAPAEHDLLRFALQTAIGIVVVVSVAGYALAWALGNS